MSLIPETGVGVVGADTYASQAYIDAYWVARPHDAKAALWAAATSVNKDGAAREATAFIDATYGPHCLGTRSGTLQGLLWPRTGAKDAAGYDLPGLPAELQRAVAELAGRAISARLSADAKRAGAVKRNKVDTIEQEFFEGASTETKFGFVAGLLAPVLDGTQPGASSAKWAWN